jgi:molybdenum cofactor biosynthesis protein B
MSHSNKIFVSLNIAVLTVSDTRDASTDTSGEYLASSATEQGHTVARRDIVIDDIYRIRAKVSDYIANPDIHAILITGGTGFTKRDSTPEALTPLFDKEVEGFGELFRYLSFKEIGTSTIQSRAVSGLANNTVIFCVPGSTGACKTAWQGIIKAQLDGAQGPCNFVPHLKANADLCASRTQ